jgi:CRP-like cAMP-binding protein
VYGCVLDGALALEVAKRARFFALPADLDLFREGDAPKGIYFLRKGNVELTIQSAGRVVMFARAEAGSLLGLPSTVSNGPYSMTATACLGAEIGHLSCEDFLELIASRPELSLEVVQILAAELRSVRQALAGILFQ